MLTGYGQYKKITIDSSKIDAGLTHFPVAIPLGLSVGLTNADVTDIFDEVGVSYLKIAVTMADGTTQLYVEVEEWDAVSERALLWVSRDTWTISSTADTEIYLYFDAGEADNTTYVGTPGNRTEVWNSDFSARYGMSQDPSGGADCIIDSTVNVNHGTPQGSMTSGDLVEAQIGGGIDFDGVDDHIDLGTMGVFGSNMATSGYLFKIKTTSTAITGYLGTFNDDLNTGIQIKLNSDESENNVSGKIYGFIRADGNNALYFATTGDTGFNDGSEHRIAVTFDGANNIGQILVDGVSFSLSYGNTMTPTSLSNFQYYMALAAINVRGTIVLFSDVVVGDSQFLSVIPSSVWIKADYHTQADNLLTFGATETSSLTISCTTGSINIVGNSCNITVEEAILCSLGQLTINPFNCIVKSTITVHCNVNAITINPFNCVVLTLSIILDRLFALEYEDRTLSIKDEDRNYTTPYDRSHTIEYK